MSLSATSRTQESTLIPSKHNAPNETLGKEVLDYLRTTDGVRKFVLELFSTIADWITLNRPNARLNDLSTNVKQAKNVVALGKLPEELVKTAGQAAAVYREKSIASIGQLINRICVFLMPAAEVADVFHKRVSPLSARSVLAMNLLGNGASAYAGTYDLAESVQKIQDAANPVLQAETGVAGARDRAIQTGQGVIGSAGAIADIAGGLLGLLSITTTFVVAPWIILALSTQSLLCTIGGRLYPQIHRLVDRPIQPKHLA